MKNFIFLLSVVAIVLLQPARAERYLLPPSGSSMVGQLAIISARHEDTFIHLARKFAVGFQELVIANSKVDPWLPGEGTQIVVPSRYILPDTAREGLVLNLAEMRLYYYPGNSDSGTQYVHTYPISIGKEGWHTPHSLTRVISRLKDPTWFPPESIRKEHAQRNDPLPASVPPGPDNPLGKYALRLALPGYLIHGTNEPRGIGMKVTHGCIRLHPDDIKDLFNRVSIGTPVTIVNQPYKLTWHSGQLYAEMHPNEGNESKTNSRHLTQFVKAVITATGSGKDYKVNWKLANDLAKTKTGLPVIVGTQRQ